MTIVVLLMLCGFALWIMTPEERARLARAVLVVMRQLRDAATQGDPEPFRNALRARTRWVLVTPALVALNVTIFVFMIFRGVTFSDSAALVDWGGSWGPRTTNGEWWRLVTMTFVNSGMLHLAANAVGMLQLGFLLERLFGSLAFAAVYVAAAVLASVVSLSAYPMAVGVGASGAIFGLYGLLLASLIWGVLHSSAVTIPLMTLKRLGPAAAIFISYNVATDGLGTAAELAGLVTGLVCGLILARGVSGRKPSARQIAATMAATIAIAVGLAVPLRGIADVRPEIARIVALEDRTVSVYRDAVDRFRKSRITAETLAGLIERTIIPELQAADAHLKILDRVPDEHQPLVANAEEYLRLREESWRLRAEGLRKTNILARPEQASYESRRRRAEAQYRTNMLALGKAETTERASLEALERIRPVEPR